MRRKFNSGFSQAVAPALILFVCVSANAGKEATVDELKARLPSVSAGDRVGLCIEIAERQLIAADKSYSADEVEKARAALDDVASFSEQARDYSIQSRKRQKQTEISVRKMTRKLGDIKRTVTHEEQAIVQAAIDRLQRVRDDLLAAMFPKGGK
jgi:hypothetical protein